MTDPIADEAASVAFPLIRVTQGTLCADCFMELPLVWRFAWNIIVFQHVSHDT